MEHSRRNKTAPPKVSLAMMQRFDPTLRSGFHFPAAPHHQPTCLPDRCLASLAGAGCCAQYGTEAETGHAVNNCSQQGCVGGGSSSGSNTSGYGMVLGASHASGPVLSDDITTMSPPLCCCSYAVSWEG